MQELIRAVIALFIQGAIFLLLGGLLMNRLKMKADAGMAYILGFILYFSLFEILAVPMTLKWVRLHVLCIIWGSILVLLCGYALVVLRKQMRIKLNVSSIVKEHSVFIVLAIAAVMLQCLIVILYQDTTVDATYYIGTVSTSVYTDTMQRYSPYSGKLLKKMSARYVFSAFPLSNAFWCKVLGIHTMVQCKIVMSVLHVCMANLVMYKIGTRLFHGGKKQADLMLVFVCLMQLFTYTQFTPGTFFFTRAYEGKAMLANITFPLVLYCTVWLWQEASDPSIRNMWIMLFLTAISALAFSGSAVILPAVVAAGIVPVMILRKNKTGIVALVLSMMPIVAYFSVYLAAKLGYLTLRAS